MKTAKVKLKLTESNTATNLFVHLHLLVMVCCIIVTSYKCNSHKFKHTELGQSAIRYSAQSSWDPSQKTLKLDIVSHASGSSIRHVVKGMVNLSQTF